MPSQSLDQDSLLTTAISEGAAALQRAIETFPTESFYVFCFYTDNDVTSIYPTANTVEALQRIDGYEDDENYYRWSPAEWQLDFGQYGKPDLMAQTNKLLYPDYESESEEPDECFDLRKQKTLNTLTTALLSIRESGLFSCAAAHEQLAFWVNISDPYGAEIEWMLEPAFKHLRLTDSKEIGALFEYAE